VSVEQGAAMKKPRPVKQAVPRQAMKRRSPAAQGSKRPARAKRQAGRPAPARLRLSPALLESINNTLPDAIISTDPKLNIVSCNQSVKRVLGYEPEELAGKNYQILIPEALREDAAQQARLEELVARGYFEQEDFTFQRKNGEIFPANFSMAMVKDEQGRPLGAVGAIRDISERKRAEAALRESEERYRTLVETSPDAITLADLEGTIIMVNPQALAMHGARDSSEMVGRKGIRFIAPQDQARAVEDLRELGEGRRFSSHEYHLLRLDGREFPAEVCGALVRDGVGRPLGYLGVARDISERKRADEALRESEERFRRIFEVGPLGMALSGGDFRFVKVNAAFCEMIGYSERELSALTFRDITHPEHLAGDEVSIQKLRAGEIPLFRTEKRYLRKDGGIAWGETTVSTIRDEAGKFLYFLALIQNITERKRAEEALRESEARYRNLVENSLSGVGLSQGNQVLYANPALLKIFGYDNPEEFYRLPLLEHVAPGSRALIQGRMERIRQGQPIEPIFEYQNIRRDGEIRTLQALTVPFDVDGKRLTQTTFLDITERKRAEEALRESEERYRSLVETSPDAIIFASLEGTILMVNPRAAGLWGATDAGELIGKPAFDFIVSEDRPGAEVNLHSLVESGRISAIEFKLVRKDGTALLVDLSASVVKNEAGRPLGLIGVVRDITERKRAEEALRESEERYRSLVETSPDAIIMTDLEGNILMMNPQALKLSRSKRFEDRLGRNAFGLIAPEDRGRAYENLVKTLETGTTRSLEYTLMRDDGTSYPGELNASVLHDASGQPIGFIGMMRDVTERKQAQEALQESEQRYRTLFDDSPISLWEEDFSRVKAHLDQLRQQGIQDFRQYFEDHPEEVFHCATLVRLVDVNWATLALYQAKDKGELLRGLAKTFTQENYDSFLKQLLATAEGRTRFESEMVNQTLTGEKKNVVLQWLVAPGHEENFSKVLVSIIDVTERKRLEAQILHAQKLESLGILAGGVAHDFNNLLVSVLGHAGLALGRTPRDSASRKNLEQIEIAARRAAELTKQMLAYSGRGTFEVRPLDLSRLVEEMAHLLEVAISKKVKISYHFGANLPAIEADATQVRQLVMNLITNASEAIGDENGTITVTTGVMSAERAYLSETYLNEELPEGWYDYLEVSDTGCGLDKETQAKIFDPFFSTKFTGRGLGLASALGIVRGHRGAIKVYSEPGRGTTFKVLFPISAQAAREITVPAISVEGWRGQGTILVVDDEEEVRVVTRSMLEEFGFTALLAADGRQGVELFRQHAGEIAAVLLDLTMPGLSGEETLQQLLQIQPEVRVILTSGYNELEATRRFAGQGIASFIQKPYQTLVLVQKMREVLESKTD
jgi:PAS domain S-box-containing protein